MAHDKSIDSGIPYGLLLLYYALSATSPAFSPSGKNTLIAHKGAGAFAVPGTVGEQVLPVMCNSAGFGVDHANAFGV